MPPPHAALVPLSGMPWQSSGPEQSPARSSDGTSKITKPTRHDRRTSFVRSIIDDSSPTHVFLRQYPKGRAIEHVPDHAYGNKIQPVIDTNEHGKQPQHEALHQDHVTD